MCSLWNLGKVFREQGIGIAEQGWGCRARKTFPQWPLNSELKCKEPPMILHTENTSVAEAKHGRTSHREVVA